MTHPSIARTTGWLTAAVLVGAALFAPTAALAAAPAPDHTVTTCHATNSDPNPHDPCGAADAADPTAPADPSTPADPSAPADPGEGTFVIDGPFVTPTPSGTVLGTVGTVGTPGTPGVTPPATDTLEAAALVPAGDAGIRPMLLLLAGSSILALLAGRVPGARRR